MFLRQPRPRQVFHPVPPALAEICKLCQISSGAGVGDGELIGQARSISMSGLGARNSNSLAAVLDSAALPGRTPNELVSALFVESLRRPDFELLRPAVVIRRRPQRP